MLVNKFYFCLQSIFSQVWSLFNRTAWLWIIFTEFTSRTPQKCQIYISLYLIILDEIRTNILILLKQSIIIWGYSIVIWILGHHGTYVWLTQFSFVSVLYWSCNIGMFLYYFEIPTYFTVPDVVLYQYYR